MHVYKMSESHNRSIASANIDILVCCGDNIAAHITHRLCIIDDDVDLMRGRNKHPGTVYQCSKEKMLPSQRFSMTQHLNGLIHTNRLSMKYHVQILHARLHYIANTPIDAFIVTLTVNWFHCIVLFYCCLVLSIKVKSFIVIDDWFLFQ